MTGGCGRVQGGRDRDVGGGGDGARDGSTRDTDDLAAAVLDVVDLIPPGSVMTYGDIAEYLGQGGPRQVGRVMSRWGGAVAWWRVLRADGSPPPGHEREALSHYRAEGTALTAGGTRVDLRTARWTGPPAGPDLDPFGGAGPGGAR